jgi:hypothetical protein
MTLLLVASIMAIFSIFGKKQASGMTASSLVELPVSEEQVHLSYSAPRNQFSTLAIDEKPNKESDLNGGGQSCNGNQQTLLIIGQVINRGNKTCGPLQYFLGVLFNYALMETMSRGSRPSSP